MNGSINALNSKYLLIGLALLVAAAGGVALKPTRRIADQGPKIDLETMIPKQFADWNIDENVVPLQVNPQLLEVMNRIYNQTLSRTYINQKGERVMLSIADCAFPRPKVNVPKYLGNFFKPILLLCFRC